MEVLLLRLKRIETRSSRMALGNKIGVIKNDMEDLIRSPLQTFIDLAGKMVRSRSGEALFNLANHRNKPV